MDAANLENIFAGFCSILKITMINDIFFIRVFSFFASLHSAHRISGLVVLKSCFYVLETESLPLYCVIFINVILCMDGNSSC